MPTKAVMAESRRWSGRPVCRREAVAGDDDSQDVNPQPLGDSVESEIRLRFKREGRSEIFISERGASTPKSEHEHELHQHEHEHSPSRLALCKAGGKC